MTTTTKGAKLVLALMLITGSAMAQNSTPTRHTISSSEPIMKTYVIEREIPEAGKFTADQLKSISQKSCSVLNNMGPKIKWLHSYVTGNKIYCVYQAENEELIKEHAKKGGFPANSISEVKNVISPETAKD
jgi:hypothetical protein